MSLSGRCSHDFNRRDWQRGAEYFRSGSVAIDQVESYSLTAAVMGSAGKPYDVYLDWSQASSGYLAADCSCPRCADRHLCKHIAATILSADAKGVRVPGSGRLSVMLDEDDPNAVYAAEDDDDIEMNDGDEGWDPIDSPDGGALAVIARMARRLTAPRRPARRAKPPANTWKKSLSLLRIAQEEGLEHRFSVSRVLRKSSERQLWYGLDVQTSQRCGVPSIAFRQRTLKKDGTLGQISKVRLTRSDIASLECPEDRSLMGLLIGNEAVWSDLAYSSYSQYGGYGQEFGGAFLSPAMIDIVLPRLCASGRFGWIAPKASRNHDEIHPLAWDDGPEWRFELTAGLSDDRKRWQIRGDLVRGAEIADLKSPVLLMAAGIVVFPDRVARLATAAEGFQWIAFLRETQLLEVPIKQQSEFLEQLAAMPEVPRGKWPDELSWQDEWPAPQPLLRISPPAKNLWRKDLECRLEFAYGDWRIAFGASDAARFDRETRRVVHRDLTAEAAARDQLLRAGAKRNPYNYGDEPLLVLAPKKLSNVVTAMTAAGWQVEAEGRLIRQPGEFRISITSSVDWFDLNATCDFDGVPASLPKLLEALRRGQNFVELGDGSRGMLPANWLARYAPLAELGEAKGDQLRFVPTQAALLDALLAAQESQDVVVDEAFTRLRERLHSFQGIQPMQEPANFGGELRHYQREGLGWLHFLQDFNFGGCLADDMGLGKTVQVLALLEERRGLSPFAESAEKTGAVPLGAMEDSAAKLPSLVVVPRSLVFNWIQEARRFTPQLRVLNYTGLERKAVRDQLTDFDLVVTTYGTLRRDIVQLKDIQFDYAILDEAQAVKNATSQAAKAVRLLRARHRLAMTGTPVENHLGELWSLLEFLNPGMLGRCGKLTDLFVGRRGKRANGETNGEHNGGGQNESLSLLARALRPFLLRRTKQQVLTELPPKSEQTLYCELDEKERKLYDELREHYRQSLLARISRDGVNKSKIHVLEALLRLRQAACHPGLLDKKKTRESSSKLETLLEQLAEVVSEGHKALVFSQFTSLLAIVRHQLDQRKIVYEYLDGKTVKRQQHVERFQTDPVCPLFLISLKAGGQGLNLTAADYVFILDPWWNPAVEAQAVDRAHRIGQNRHVFAYRLIARDTVEEKILELQAHKRDLAEAIISADNSLLRNLTAEDLQLLLS